MKFFFRNTFNNNYLKIRIGLEIEDLEKGFQIDLKIMECFVGFMWGLDIIRYVEV